MVQSQLKPYDFKDTNFFGSGVPMTAAFQEWSPLYNWSWENSIILRKEERIDYLSRYYEFIDPIEINNFLLRNHFIIDILIEALEKIKEFFGAEVKILLEIITDPEEGFDELFIVIKSNYSVTEARNRLNKLVIQWFLTVSDQTQGILNITEEPL